MCCSIIKLYIFCSILTSYEQHGRLFPFRAHYCCCIKPVSTSAPLQVPHGARHKWERARRESLTRSHSWLNLRMNSWWMSSSTDRSARSCQTDWTWATNKWKYGFRTAGWRRSGSWCASRLSPRTDWPLDLIMTSSAQHNMFCALRPMYECVAAQASRAALGLWHWLVSEA